MSIERQVITNHHSEQVEATYDGRQFRIIKDTNGSFPHIQAKNVIELELLEAQKLASFIQNCILER